MCPILLTNKKGKHLRWTYAKHVFVPSNCWSHWYKSSKSMGSSSESICKPRPATVARGQRRDNVSGRVMTLVVPAAPPSNRLVVAVTANSLCNKLPPSVRAAVVPLTAAAATTTTTTDGRVDGIATAGRLVTTPRGWRDVPRGCRLGWRRYRPGGGAARVRQTFRVLDKRLPSPART